MGKIFILFVGVITISQKPRLNFAIGGTPPGNNYIIYLIPTIVDKKAFLSSLGASGTGDVELLPLGVLREGRKVTQVSFADAETGDTLHIRGANWANALKAGVITDTDKGFAVPADALFEIEGWTAIRMRTSAPPKNVT